MKEGQEFICIKEYVINDDCVFTKGKIYKTIKRKSLKWTNNMDKWLIECNAKLNPKPLSDLTTIPISFLKDEFSEYLMTKKQIRKLKLKKIENNNLMSGTVESIGPKNVKIYFNTPPFKQMHISKPFDKVAEPDENICIVWEQWKGSRGGYRIERQLYQNKLKPAKNWPYQALVWEDSYGKESES